MDKQKQIEEVEIYTPFNNNKEKQQIYLDLLPHCQLVFSRFGLELVENLYNLGYRKIPENAVVLTREEYNNMFSFKTTRGGFYNILDTVRKVERKETAEEFERLANERIAKEQGERDGYDTYRIDNKAKYDGDIVSFVLFEICKEITDKGVQNGD